MRTTLTRALVGLGLAGALFLGAGAAVAQTTGDESSSDGHHGPGPSSRTATGTAPPTDCPERSGNDNGSSDESTDLAR